mmetsp:Transcript_3155/g.8538  ORF Transcript_3155/g.8538 Transcript_3155/m.8538 type:complete len:134 (-) Transcript_3155:334-735(-)|eukprot:CAMPEP_0197196320 /NCGR_PEP_ID=MMETSP1423-20130617/32295_1 /TAXON_ID=476441 /ORGANISM="Pseudo-nitzschia heimii, Strain UNC1101" /LENGTH=133 /DNA_ID=CAMNT_0042650111 /DNA_START=504 /DNA_END=905 /DNA_ORIENTATION=-
MGKGSNVQKAQQARERNAKKMGKTDEERRAASAKARQDSCAKKCIICLQTFMVNSKPPLLYQHIVAKHPDLMNEPTRCFPELAGFDPNDPKGLKAAAAAKDADKKKKSKKGGSNADSLDDLLNAGLKKGKKKI